MHHLMRTLLLCLLAFNLPAPSSSCTRLVYQGPNGTVLTARSMDWKGDIPANMWVFPRGMERNGEVGPASVQWKSRYGSVIVSSWDIASSDGMNEQGLVANMLWLVESEYPAFTPGGQRRGLSISLWAQYALDNFANVKEAVEALRKEEFVVVTDKLPGTDRVATVHLSLSDASGDNAILEYIGGRLTIHHDRSYTVMTNSPTFDQQLALNAYWQSIGGTVMLPGTNRAADRFARASFYLKAIPQTDDTRIAVASVFSVIRNCSVPFGISSESEPNISNTRWRVVADQRNLVYFYEDVLTPNAFWVDLKKLDFGPKGKVRKLALAQQQVYSGETSRQFVEAKPFTFMGL
ncbi:MAG: linear amide C-N hydrolase [Flavobacteriales bacterium]|nr:linear amide C-N hydrolase [Flavobacteriales bacterium]